MKFLITGFEPFQKQKINPSWEAIKNLEINCKNIQIFKKEIPVLFNKSIEILKKEILKTDPDIIILLGQAGGRAKISLEKLAVNLNEAPIPDNNGYMPINQKIYPDKQGAYFTSLPIKKACKHIEKLSIPIECSYSAGTYVCNHLYYGLLAMIDTEFTDKKGLFIHIPFIKTQVKNLENIPFLDIDKISLAIRELVLFFSENQEEDISLESGKLH